MITKVPGLENPRLIALTLTRTLTRTLNPRLIARLIARDSLAAARSSPLHAPRPGKPFAAALALLMRWSRSRRDTQPSITHSREFPPLTQVEGQEAEARGAS